jgi:hypothetical protein
MKHVKLFEEVEYYGADPVKRKYTKKVVPEYVVPKTSDSTPTLETIPNECFLITWTESDETHFMLIPMKHFTTIEVMNKKLSGSRLSVSEVDKILGEIYKLKIETFFVQTYCTEDWPFEKYNIKKIISIPELGY